MTKLYSTTNPQGLIDLFEMRAKIANEAALRTGANVREQSLLKREAVTWRAAADIIRNTEFVGWNVVEIDATNWPRNTAIPVTPSFVRDHKKED